MLPLGKVFTKRERVPVAGGHAAVPVAGLAADRFHEVMARIATPFGRIL
jgi:hypothetical protein